MKNVRVGPVLLLMLALSVLVASSPATALGVAVGESGNDENLPPILKIMTFNLRYGTAEDGPNSWDENFGTGSRKTIMVDLIENYWPTIIGIQEGMKFQLDYLTEQLENYSWFGVSRRGTTEDEYNAIFYETSRVELEEGGNFWLSDTPDVPGSISWKHSLPRMVTWGKFEVEGYSGSIYVFNTHFSHVSLYAREKSADLLHEVASDVGFEYPVFITGDFNSSPGGYAWGELTEDGFEDSWEVSDIRSGPEFTGHGFEGLDSGGGRRIDWILCRLPASGGVQMVEMVAFNENGRYPSDHFPVYAEIELREGVPPEIVREDLLEVSKATVEANEQFKVGTAAMNEGGLGSIELGFYVDGKLIESREVVVKAGENRRIDFTHRLYEPGDHEVTIDDLPPVTVAVTPRPAEFECRDLEVTMEAGYATVGVTVKNIGSFDGSENIELELDEEVVDSKSLTLGPGEEEGVSFTVPIYEKGTHEVGIGGLTESFNAYHTAEREGEGVPLLPVIGGVIVVIVVIAGVLLWRKR